ncbi:class I SAM-dependent methyltransferase [Nocardiopsis sp. CC223A]|uniref:class I SAM-dependent DNA methyltransferase n=1 Tax=Nocardiopsis sp. CC223A TaxID=3044051 RepID=UPI00278BEC11|nr:class I SAM-dependent methyltransferase [Nocardiopsis sp. CC223A]
MGETDETVGDAYGALAREYAASADRWEAGRPLDRALLPVFAELVRGGGPVLDAGCGPGRLTARLRDLGVEAFGVDLSPGMVALARESYPGLRFEVGDLADPVAAEGTLGGILAHYSVIHDPPGRLPVTLAGFHRMLRAGGYLLLAFQALDDPGMLCEPFDHRVAPAHRYSPERVSVLAGEAGLAEVARLVIAGGEDERRGFPQAHLLLRKQV